MSAAGASGGRSRLAGARRPDDLGKSSAPAMPASLKNIKTRMLIIRALLVITLKYLTKIVEVVERRTHTESSALLKTASFAIFPDDIIFSRAGQQL